MIYAGFALMTFAAYGVVIHDGTGALLERHRDRIRQQRVLGDPGASCILSRRHRVLDDA
jgi:hypothetical protein